MPLLLGLASLSCSSVGSLQHFGARLGADSRASAASVPAKDPRATRGDAAPEATPQPVLQPVLQAVLQPRQIPTTVDGFPVAVLDNGETTRLLRGDFEPPETLVLAYDSDWGVAVEQIIAAARGQSNVVVLSDDGMGRAPRSRWARQPHVRVVDIRLDSPWVRDFGPVQATDTDEGPIWLDLAYAADRPLDDHFPTWLATLFEAQIESPSYSLDGGAVISNGDGLCAMTRYSLENAGYYDPADGSMQSFLASVGCSTTAILPTTPRETTGHADVVAQFLEADLAMVAWIDPDQDPELAPVLDEAADNLAVAAELGGYELSVFRVPIGVSGEVFYSYVNTTRLTSRLLVPSFPSQSKQLEHDAYAILQAALPDLELVPIDADAMVARGGAVHCVTLGLGPAANRLGLPAAVPN